MEKPQNEEATCCGKWSMYLAGTMAKLDDVSHKMGANRFCAPGYTCTWLLEITKMHMYKLSNIPENKLDTYWWIEHDGFHFHFVKNLSTG